MSHEVSQLNITASGAGIKQLTQTLTGATTLLSGGAHCLKGATLSAISVTLKIMRLCCPVSLPKHAPGKFLLVGFCCSFYFVSVLLFVSLLPSFPSSCSLHAVLVRKIDDVSILLFILSTNKKFGKTIVLFNV